MAIKKGDRLILKQYGRETTVEAVSNEHDGTVQIMDKGVISTASVYDLRPDDEDPGMMQGSGSR